MSSQLLVTFCKESSLNDLVLEIQTTQNLNKDKIFVLKTKEPELIISYSVENDGTSFLSKTVPVHRKKESNTIYTINALNALVRKLNDGFLDKNFLINWSTYKDSILLYEKGNLKILGTNIYKIINN